MDTGHTYGTPAGLRVMLYVTDDFTVPETIELTRDGQQVTFHRISPNSLYCADVSGVSGSCGSADCHRMPLGQCQCGRHGRGPDGETVPLRFVRAVR